MLDIWRESLTETKSKYLIPQDAKVAPEPQKSTVQSASMDTKIERKRAAPQPPSSASKVSVEPVRQSGASPSSIVEKMRQSRGQMVYQN
jgi:hypothetical protein